jgi:hypothetical protein
MCFVGLPTARNITFMGLPGVKVIPEYTSPGCGTGGACWSAVVRQESYESTLGHLNCGVVGNISNRQPQHAANKDRADNLSGMISA